MPANPRLEKVMWTPHRILPALLFSAATLALMPACAAQVYGYRGDYARELERHAYDNGYRSGLRAGERDARDGRVFEMERQRDWRDADGGYQRDFGDRELYRRVFRDGFRAGYSEAFNRRAVVIAPRAAAVSPAAQIGYRDGFDAGRNDGRDRDRYDPQRARRYREGDHDYDRRYGSRDDYAREYRAAFQRGYDEGYRGARR